MEAEDIKIVIANNGKMIYPEDKPSREVADNLIASAIPGSNQIFYDGRCYQRSDKIISGVGLIVVFVDITSLKKEVTEELKENFGVDETTGLSTKKFTDNRILEYLEGLKNNPESFTLVMADIDHFKNINDTYGHQFGDIVLNIISQSLKQGLRNTDIIGRYGGEEIFFVIKGALLENVITKLNQLLLKIQNTVIPRLDSYVTSPTISFGAIHVAKADIEHLADDSSALLSDLISKADKALYYSKENGRNQYTIDSYANGKTYTRVFNEAIQERRKPDVQSV